MEPAESRDVFISYVEEDEDIAVQVSQGLESEGYTTWYYKRDQVPIVRYLEYLHSVIRSCKAVAVIVTNMSVHSFQVTGEVECAYEANKPFLPILVDIPFPEFERHAPLWRQAFGTTGLLQTTRVRVASEIPRMVAGLKAKNINPSRPASKLTRERLERETVEIARVLGDQVAIEQHRVFYIGMRPPLKGVFGRDGTVEDVSTAIREGASDFACLFGPAGIGKSTLAALVFSKLSGDGERFERCIWYDLRSEPDAETALLNLLTIVTGGRFSSPVSSSVTFDMLLNVLRTRLSLEFAVVVLDNLDSVFDPSSPEAGEFVDKRWPELIRAFLGFGSAVIVTSRQKPKIEVPQSMMVEVEGISAEDSIALMRSGGLKDSEEVFREAHELLQGHPMALRALTSAVMRRPSYGGRLSRAGDIMDVLRKAPDQSMNPVALFEEIIKPERMTPDGFSLITAMTVLHRPETALAIAALRPDMLPNNVEFVLDELYLRSLVQLNDDLFPPLYSLHPIVREVAEERLSGEEAAQLHKLACDYYVSLPWDPCTTNPADVEHLRLATLHALKANDLERAKDVLYGYAGLACRLRQWGRYDLAQPLHLLELQTARRLGTDEDVMRAADFLSKCMMRLGKPEDALPLAKEALAIAVALGDKARECSIRADIGKMLFLTTDPAQAAKWLEEAVKLAETHCDRATQGYTKGILGQIRQKQTGGDDALDLLNEAAEIAAECGDVRSEIDYRATVGHIWFLRGQYDRAMDILESVYAKAVAAGDKAGECKTGFYLGEVQLAKARIQQARETIERVLQVAREIGDRSMEGSLMGLLAKVHAIKGEYDQALTVLGEARKIKSELGLAAGEAFQIGKTGEVYLQLGKLDLAMEYLLNAYDFALKAGNRTNECVWRGRIGEVHLRRGELEKAREWLESALRMSIELKDRENEAEWRAKLGLLFAEEGELAKACEYLEQAVAIAAAIEDPISELHHRISLGRCYMLAGRHREAIPQLERSLEISSLADLPAGKEEAEALLREARGACEELDKEH